MKRFLLKLCLFLTLFSIIAGTVLVFTFTCILPQYSGTYNAAICDKIDRMNTIQEPKIVLAGNSSLAFGLDSSALEEAFGMPVVNTGLHAGLGMAFQLNLAKTNLQQGDIVIVCNPIDTIPVEQPKLAWITIENYHLWSLIPSCSQIDMLRVLPQYIFESTMHWLLGSGNQPQDGWYSRQAFNEYGDICYPRPESLYTFTSSSTYCPVLTADHIDLLQEFIAYCHDQGAVCLISTFPLAYGEYTAPIQDFQLYQQELENAFGDIVISNITDYKIEYQYFFDTHLHLTDEGTEIRTRQLIQDLQNWGL